MMYFLLAWCCASQTVDEFDGGDEQGLMQFRISRNTADVDAKVVFVANPEQQNVSTFGGSTFESTDMVKMSISAPSSGTSQQTLAIFGYPLAQDKHVSGGVKRSGGWESDTVQKIYRIFEQHRVGHFLDVGGNIGTYSLPLAYAFKGSDYQVFTVEGMPSIAAHLKKGIVDNGLDNIHLFEYAVSSPVVKSELTMSLNPENKGGSAVMGNKKWTHNSDIQQVTVPLTTIDAMREAVPELSHILVAKMDIEGNEGLALLGAQSFMQSSPPCYLFIELVPEWLENAGTSLSSVKEQLERSGYDTSEVSSRNAAATYALKQRDIPACVERVAAVDPLR